MFNVEQRVKEVITDQLLTQYSKKQKLKLETRINEDLDADSLDRVELLIALEAEFDTNIPDELAEEIKTVGDVVKCLS